MTDLPAELERPSAPDAGDRAAAQGDRGRARASTGRRPSTWPSPAAGRGLPGPAFRRGCRPRHLQPAPRGDLRPGDRGAATSRLQHLQPEQASFEVIDSLLSEEGVLGFEYGYSLADPNCLTFWEAQFGDFANGAQVYSTSSSARARASGCACRGLVCLLPHGYEGQGPEHSSARLERFLQLYAENNIQVVYPSTPASYFHALRRQLHREFRKPLIVMTPKSLLRHKRCVSTLEELAPGSSFHRVLWETPPCRGRPGRRAGRAVQRQGLLRPAAGARGPVARGQGGAVRLEQLAPFPEEALEGELRRYRDRRRASSGARRSRATWAPGSSWRPGSRT